MKKKILKNLAIFSTLICITIALAISFLYYTFYQKNEMYKIKSDCKMFASILNNGEPLSILNKIQSGETRITLVSKDGKVLLDTDANVANLENHLGRIEIQQAIKYGWGESLRYSNTLNKDLYYYAIMLNDGSVIRISKPLNSITSLFRTSIPFVLAIMLIFIIVANYISVSLTRKIIGPLNAASQHLDGVLTEDYIEFEELASYEEFLPFIRKIRYLNKEIRSYAKQVKSQSTTINSITSNMQEGLILLDSKQHVLSINQGARKMMGVSLESDYINQPLISLCRNSKVVDTIEFVLSNKTNSYVDLESNQQFYKYFFSPVLKDDGTIRGVIILIVNATAEMKSARIRRDFASNVSHELKTPLTSINGFSEMLENSMIVTSEDVIKTAAMIHKESSRMISLIDDIIRLSQIESGANVPSEKINLADTVNEVMQALTTVADEKTVSLSEKTQPIQIVANPSMAYELVYNLCDNAIKYNNPNGTVSVTLVQVENNAVITVSDTGIGIAEEHLDRIFERFYRVDKSRSKQTGGTGLGLSIVKHIAESLKGTISIQSEIGKGTTITVTIPIAN